MNLLDIAITKAEGIIFDRTKVINFFVWLLIGVNGVQNGWNIIGICAAFGYIVIGIESIYSPKSKFSKLMPAEKSKVILVDFIIYYFIISIVNIIYSFVEKGALLQGIFYASIVFSIGIILRYYNGVLSGILLAILTVIGMFLPKEIDTIIISKISNVDILVLVGLLVVISYIISLVLYKKRIFINRI